MTTSSFIKQHFLTLSLSVAISLSYVGSFTPWLDTSPHDDQRLIQCIFLLFFASYILVKVLQTQTIPKTLLSFSGLWLIPFFGLGILSSILAFSPRMGFYETTIFLLLILTSLSIAEEISKSPQQSIKWMLKICGYGCLLYTFKLSVAYTTIFLVGKQPMTGDFILGFSKYRFFNHTQTITLPLLVLLFLIGSHNGKKKYLWILLSGFWWALVFMLAARGTFIGLMAGCTIAYLLKKSQAVPFCKAMLLSALIGVAMYAVFFVAIPLYAGLEPFGEFFNLTDRTTDNPSSGRLALWQLALKLIVDNPWLGSGPMHYAHYSNSIGTNAHPHNWVLQIGAEWGLPALLFVCIAIFSAFYCLVKTSAGVSITDFRNQDFATTWIVIGMAILVDGLFSGLIVMPLSQCLISFYIGCATGWVQSFENHKALRCTSKNRLRSISFSLLILFSLSILFMVLWSGIMRFQDNNNKSLEDPEIMVQHATRLWGQGRF